MAMKLQKNYKFYISLWKCNSDFKIKKSKISELVKEFKNYLIEISGIFLSSNLEIFLIFQIF